MPWMCWLIVVASMALYVIIIRQQVLREREREYVRQLALRPEKLWMYVEVLHAQGVGSVAAEDLKESLKYGEGGELDDIFLRRSEVMDELFVMKKRIWEGH